ncbi:cell adhesion molecule CEACAM19 isoform X3 [Castor canadensis]|uniref:Cell adhesion molecule CEACAM19 isoform X3 n=1 Tax=Castor canadensis TaxID=51338 RepID=A0AC58L957_CASCN
MEILKGTQGSFPKVLLLTASILALWLPQGSWATLHIQKIPERPQKDQDLLLSVLGVPNTFQDFTWYLGEDTDGGTRLFTYIPELQRPQRDGSAMGQRDIVGFQNGSLLLRRAQPSDSGTYQVAVTVNPAWTMRAKTEVQVAEINKQPSTAHLPLNAWMVAAAIIGPLAFGFFLIGSIAYLLVTRGWRGRSPRTATTEKPELGPTHDADDNNVYEVMPSPVFLVSPISDMGPMNSATDLLNPDLAPYSQLVPAP